jgi:hypothetical protein
VYFCLILTRNICRVLTVYKAKGPDNGLKRKGAEQLHGHTDTKPVCDLSVNYLVKALPGLLLGLPPSAQASLQRNREV